LLDLNPYFSLMIRQVNQLAGNRTPFLLIVDFEMKMPLLYRLDQLPADMRFSFPGVATSGEAVSSLQGSPGFPDGNLFDAAYSHDKVNTSQAANSRDTVKACNTINSRDTLNTCDAAKSLNAADPQLEAEPVPYERYLAAFNLVRENTLAGNTYLCNLTFPSRLWTRMGLSEIYEASRAKYKLLYGDRFVVFSPETFVQIREGRIRSFPMKGTIDAGIPGARDLLLNDRKETAEHVTIVDLIRNDLSIHASRVRVEKFRYIDTLVTSRKTLLQVSSVITGELPGDYRSRLGEILFSMLPAGSVSGAPKRSTLRIIREAEGSDRGYYTGVMGIFDGNDFDSAVMIRYVENREGELYYRSGGGITHLSDPEKEYREMIDKVYVPLA
jgi:para-aminobenzoate synthetase component 1